MLWNMTLRLNRLIYEQERSLEDSSKHDKNSHNIGSIDINFSLNKANKINDFSLSKMKPREINNYDVKKSNKTHSRKKTNSNIRWYNNNRYKKLYYYNKRSNIHENFYTKNNINKRIKKSSEHLKGKFFNDENSREISIINNNSFTRNKQIYELFYVMDSGIKLRNISNGSRITNSGNLFINIDINIIYLEIGNINKTNLIILWNNFIQEIDIFIFDPGIIFQLNRFDITFIVVIFNLFNLINLYKMDHIKPETNQWIRILTNIDDFNNIKQRIHNLFYDEYCRAVYQEDRIHLTGIIANVFFGTNRQYNYLDVVVEFYDNINFNYDKYYFDHSQINLSGRVPLFPDNNQEILVIRFILRIDHIRIHILCLLQYQMIYEML